MLPLASEAERKPGEECGCVGRARARHPCVLKMPRRTNSSPEPDNMTLLPSFPLAPRKLVTPPCRPKTPEQPVDDKNSPSASRSAHGCKLRRGAVSADATAGPAEDAGVRTSACATRGNDAAMIARKKTGRGIRCLRMRAFEASAVPPIERSRAADLLQAWLASGS